MAESHTPETTATVQSPASRHGAEPHGAAHDHSHDAEHVAKHVKGYLFVGALLLFFTGVTVALSYVNFGSQNWNILVAMIVATFKAGLVAAIFMHLKGERITVWRFLLFTAIFVFGLFMLTFFHHADPIMGTKHAVHS